MKLVYDQDLIEEAVFLAASSKAKPVEPALLRRFHREREKLYAISDPDERNDAFFQLNLEWFREWEQEQLLLSALAEFPLLKSKLSLLAFRKARLKKEEGAELYATAEDRKGVVTVCPSRFIHAAGLIEFLRVELFHLHDMVSPEFAYKPLLDEARLSELQERIARERYKLLWDISIQSRLLRLKRLSLPLDKLISQFHKAFEFWSAEKRSETLRELCEMDPTHPRLVELCTDPKDLLSSHKPGPGAHCPLCGFSTFHWASEQDLFPLSAAITMEFPHWTSSQGACNRCAETYQVAMLPAR